MDNILNRIINGGTKVDMGSKPLNKKELDAFIEKHSDDIKKGHILISETKITSILINRTCPINEQEPVKDKKWLDYINTKLRKLGFKTNDTLKLHIVTKVINTKK